MALVRDPDFWRRFSRAIRLDEEAKGPSESAETVVYSHEWIQRQQHKKRKSCACGFLIAFLVCFFIAAAVVVIWWFATHNWLREPSHESHEKVDSQ